MGDEAIDQKDRAVLAGIGKEEPELYGQISKIASEHGVRAIDLVRASMREHIEKRQSLHSPQTPQPQLQNDALSAKLDKVIDLLTLQAQAPQAPQQPVQQSSPLDMVQAMIQIQQMYSGMKESATTDMKGTIALMKELSGTFNQAEHEPEDPLTTMAVQALGGFLERKAREGSLTPPLENTAPSTPPKTVGGDGGIPMQDINIREELERIPGLEQQIRAGNVPLDTLIEKALEKYPDMPEEKLDEIEEVYHEIRGTNQETSTENRPIDEPSSNGNDESTGSEPEQGDRSVGDQEGRSDEESGTVPKDSPGDTGETPQ